MKRKTRTRREDREKGHRECARRYSVQGDTSALTREAGSGCGGAHVEHSRPAGNMIMLRCPNAEASLKKHPHLHTPGLNYPPAKTCLWISQK